MILAIDANPKLHDATIIIYGHHGPRIGFWERDKSAKIDASGYNKTRRLKDFLSTFFAVRLPAGEAKTIGNPIAIHQIYERLFQLDFQAVDVEEVIPSEVSLEIYPEISASAL